MIYKRTYARRVVDKKKRKKEKYMLTDLKEKIAIYS